MATQLIRAKAAYEDCRAHLHDSGASNTSIESFLAQHLVVLLCSEMQAELYKIVEEKAACVADADVSSYITNSTRRILRSVRKDEIATLVGMFSAEAKNNLNASVNDAEITRYNNAVRSRHVVAHSIGSDVSFLEVAAAISSADRLLVAVRSALVGADVESDS